MVYQKKLETPNAEKKYGFKYEDKERKEDTGWLWGVAFYGLAFTTSIVNTAMYWSYNEDWNPIRTDI